ncbi:hypothetical protein ACLOJK_024721 [Asimina triloba]
MEPSREFHSIVHDEILHMNSSDVSRKALAFPIIAVSTCLCRRPPFQNITERERRLPSFCRQIHPHVSKATANPSRGSPSVTPQERTRRADVHYRVFLVVDAVEDLGVKINGHSEESSSPGGCGSPSEREDESGVENRFDHKVWPFFFGKFVLVVVFPWEASCV